MPTTGAWDPDAYAAFGWERLRPALDLLAHVDLSSPRRIVDLGCGSGNVTRRLAARWPQARVVGIDTAPSMLAQARETPSTITWIHADIARWQPDAAVDLVFSNAALHWLDDHQTLFVRLVSWVRPGGALAVQMPSSFGDPLHRAIADIGADGPWEPRLRPLLARTPVAPAETYIDMLAPAVDRLDVWETVYYHLVDGEQPVLDWAKGAALRPILAALSQSEGASFLDRLGVRLAADYPRRRNGGTLLPYRRLFIVGSR